MFWQFNEGFTRQQDAVETVLRRRRYDNKELLLNNRLINNNLWSLVRVRLTNEVAIRLDVFRFNGARRIWGYRSWRDEDFPKHLDCPVDFLTAATSTHTKAVGWRQTALRAQQWAQDINAYELRPGAYLTLNKTQYRLLSEQSDGSWRLREDTSGVVVTLSRHELARAIHTAVLSEFLAQLNVHDRLHLFGVPYQLKERRDPGWIAHNLRHGGLIYIEDDMLRYAIIEKNSPTASVMDSGNDSVTLHPKR